MMSEQPQDDHQKVGAVDEAVDEPVVDAEKNAVEVAPKARRKSKKKLLLKCPKCSEERSCKSLLERHIATHKEQFHKCPHCDDSFNHKGNLQRHLKRKHGPKDISVAHVCPLCGRFMTEYTVLRSHLVKVHKMPNEEARVKARGCTFNVLPQTGALLSRNCNIILNLYS